jgi:tetratricopeptide (TPR) repeat protein
MVGMIAGPLLALVLFQAAPKAGTPPAPAAPAATPRRPAAPKADPYTRVQQAKAAYEAGQYPRVLQIVDGLLKEYPKSPSSHLLRAMALDEMGRLDEAERSYAAALDASPGDAQVLARFGMHHMRRDRWPEAIRRLEQAVAAQPDALSYFYLAQSYFHTDAKGKALEAIEKSATLAPKNPTILVKLGEYRAQANKYSPALEALKSAQQLNPNEPGLDLALGVVHLGLLEVDEARAALERALVREPDNLAALSSLAQACSKARDHAAARGHYQRLIDLGHRDAPYYLGLGAALLGLGENEAAIAALTSAAAANPELAEAHFHLARAYRAVGRAEDSQRELRTFQALKANPLQPFTERSEFERDLWRRAEAALVDGNEKAALDLLAGGNVPGNQPEYLVGALYYKLGRYADAERLLARALQAAPGLPKLRAYLGLALLEQGRVAEAEQAIREEAERNPREPFVLMAEGQLHHRKKEWKEAARDLQESKVVEPAVLLMLCEAQLESGQTAEARDTAQLAATFGASRPDVVESVRKLFARHQLTLEGSPSS